MTRLKRINEYLLMIFVAVLLFLIGVTVLHSTAQEPAFAYQEYEEEQQEFIDCVENREIFERALDFHTYFLELTVDEISEAYTQLISSVQCRASHVSSSYEEVREMALVIVSEAQNYYDDEDIRIVDAVYTTNEQYSALLNQPQEYLFFALNYDQSRIVGITIRQDETGYKVQSLWEYEQSDDIEYTQSVVQKLLIVYNEIKQ